MIDNAGYDVVIIGGGIIGSAAAYYLSRGGFKVIVVDRTGVGSQASFHATGWLGVPLHYLDPPEHADFLQRANRCLKWMGPRVAEEAGMDINMREVPCLEVAMTDRVLRRSINNLINNYKFDNIFL